MRHVDPPEPGSLILKETPYGKGVFAGRPFRQGKVIIEFTGDWFTYEEQVEPCLVEDMYLQVGEDLFIGPSGGLDDSFNHSCDPNAAIVIDRQTDRQNNPAGGDQGHWRGRRNHLRLFNHHAR